MMTDKNTFNWLLLILAGVLQTAAGEVSYTPGDIWKLDGSTDWTNRPYFVGLGHIQSTGKPDTNAVWRFMHYDDVAIGPLFGNPAELGTLKQDTTNGLYRSRSHSNIYLTRPWISDTWMNLGLGPYHSRWAGAVVWESPVPGTFRIDADLIYTGGVGTVSFGVFYHDVKANAFYQLQKGFLFGDDRYGWTPVTSEVAQASVSLDAGDRLVFLQRAYVTSTGREYSYTSGPDTTPSYQCRHSEHRNLTVTLLTDAPTNPVPQTFRSWRRKDLHWRADVEDSLKPENGGTAVVRDRRLPATRPAMFSYYVSTNCIFGHADVNATGLREGEMLAPAVNGLDFFGDMQCGCREHLLYYRHDNLKGADLRAKPPVWFFRPPKPGSYSITGVLDEQSSSQNSLGSISFWIGTAILDNFGTNPVVSRITTLKKGEMVKDAPSIDIDLRCALESPNHCIYMTVWGQVDSGDRRSSIVDDLLITHERMTGTMMTIY
jgi:hypothetical protein